MGACGYRLDAEKFQLGIRGCGVLIRKPQRCAAARLSLKVLLEPPFGDLFAAGEPQAFVALHVSIISSSALVLPSRRDT